MERWKVVGRKTHGDLMVGFGFADGLEHLGLRMPVEVLRK